MKYAAGYVLLTLTLPVFSHNWHGLTGSHWHATDAWGLVALGVAITAAIWLSKGGK
jgi:hypothetical protein